MNISIDQQLKQQITILTQTKQYDKARQAARQLVQRNPKDIEAWFALSQLEEYLGDIEQTIIALCHVCQRQSPIYVQALQKTIELCRRHGVREVGIDAAAALIKAMPDNALGHFALGQFRYELGQNIAAIMPLEKAICLGVNDPVCYRILWRCQLNVGEFETAGNTISKLLDDLSDGKSVFNMKAVTYNYPSEVSNEEVKTFHLEAAEFFSNHPGLPEFEFKDKKSARIRVAYLSPDFREHPVAAFSEAIIQAHNRNKFEVFCYFDSDKYDAISERLERSADCWRSVYGLTDDELCKLIREDGVDILIDLSVYFSDTRQNVIAQRAAPIQVNYLGYPNTSGLEVMDYRITDNWADPEGMTESQFTENLVRLDGGFLCYTPPSDEPTMSNLPSENNKDICFGSFNNFSKASSQVMKLWARLLECIDGSRLLIKAQPFGEPAMCEKVWAFFEGQGISKDRIRLQGWAENISSHLELYNEVDIHLDTYPYNGTTTTIESLRQGVPVVTLAGDNHRSRVGCSILTQVGLEDLIAQSEEEYIDIAVNLAQDMKRLKTLRSELRDRVDRSSLMDRKRFITELEAAYQQMLKEKIKD